MKPIEASIPEIISGVNKVNSPIILPINTIIHSFLFIASIPARIGKIASMHPIVPKIMYCSLEKSDIHTIIARTPDRINSMPAVIGINGFFSSSIVKPFFRLLVLMKFYFFSCFSLESEALFF